RERAVVRPLQGDLGGGGDAVRHPEGAVEDLERDRPGAADRLHAQAAADVVVEVEGGVADDARGGGAPGPDQGDLRLAAVADGAVEVQQAAVGPERDGA